MSLTGLQFPWVKIPRSFGCIVAFLALAVLAAAEGDSASIKMKNGENLHCQGAYAEGDFLIIMTQYGQTKVHRSFLAPEAEQAYFGTVPAEPAEKSAPASPPAGEKPAPPPQPAASTAAEPPPPPPPPITPPGAATLPSEKNEPGQATWPAGELFSDYPASVLLPEPDLPELKTDAKVKTGKFTLPNVGPYHIDVEVIYRVPVSGAEETSQAHDMVFFCPYPTENTNLTGAHHLFVTDALGCSLVSFKFTATPAELSDPTRCYWKKEAGWYEAVLAAQDKVCELFKLEKRKLILMAESAGSNLAEGVAVAYPDRVEAAALIGGEDFGMPIPKKSPVTWLVMNSRGDSTGPASRRIAGELLASGASVLYASPAVNHGLRGNLMYHHVPGPQSRHLMSAFVWGVLRSRALGEKASFEQRFPYTVLPGEKSRFLVEATSRLPAGDRMPSPAHLFFSSSALAFSWGQVTPAVQRAQLLAGREKVNVFLGFPALPRPKAVVLLYDALTYLNYAETHEDVASLAELGMVALAPSKMGKTASIPSYCEAAKSWLASQPALQGVPLYCYGKGKSGADFLAYASTSALPNMAGFAYVDLGEGGPARESEDKIKNLADQYDAFLLGMKEDEKGENKDLERLASSMFNHKAEKRGSKKLLFKNKDSDGRIYGQCIIALNNLIDPPPAAAGDKDNDKEKEKDKKEKKK